MTTIQFRVDNQTKKNTKKILDDLGMDMSTAIKLYLRQIIRQKGIPFPLRTSNDLTIQEENEILQAAEEAKRGINVSKKMTPKQALKHLDLL